MYQYVAFLRGINVSGHHKLPMAELRKEMDLLGYSSVETVLNSGNVLFNAKEEDASAIALTISTHLEKVFGFPVPTIVVKTDLIKQLIEQNPFKDIVVTKDIRLHISFLQHETDVDLALPWSSEDESFKILAVIDKIIVSVLDLSLNSTPKAMEALEKLFGKGITTRNWNTIERIRKKLKV